MTPPEDVDRTYLGESASARLASSNPDGSWTWAKAPLEGVKDVMAQTEYPAEMISYVKGRVEETIPEAAPDRIALLRLDTDWYGSTYHELLHLYPRLAPGGVSNSSTTTDTGEVRSKPSINTSPSIVSARYCIVSTIPPGWPSSRRNNRFRRLARASTMSGFYRQGERCAGRRPILSPAQLSTPRAWLSRSDAVGSGNSVR